MAYADVTNPVIIQATASVSAKIDFFVRRYAIVSNGASTLEVGSSKVVYNSDYTDYLKMGSASEKITKDIKGFFTFAGAKELVLIEVGSEGTTQEVANLETFIASGLNRPYVTLCPDSWYNSLNQNSNSSVSIVLAQNKVTLAVGQTITIIQPTDTKVSNWNVSNGDSAILNSLARGRATDRKVFSAIGAGNTTLTLSGDYEGAETLTPFTLNVEVVPSKKNSWDITATPQNVALAYNGSAVITFPDNIPDTTEWEATINGDDYISYDSATKTITAKSATGEATILFSSPATDTHEAINFSLNVNVTETNDNPSTGITITASEVVADNPIQPEPLQATINTNTAVQNSFDSSFANLCKMYVSENSARFFMCRITNDTNPATDAIWQNYKGTKSFFGVYDNLAIDAYSLSGAILGKMANSIFDITDTNPATPLNYKTLSGATFVELKDGFINSLIQSPVNFGYELVGNPVIMNGRYSDGSAWEYWYQWDTICLALEQKLATLLLNGVNNPNYVIAYNQTGIDILESGIISVLKTYQSRGAITSFARSVDVGTNELIDEGYIVSIPFAEYSANNKEKYENEIYDGFSFYLMIGRYIRQVVVNVSLA